MDSPLSLPFFGSWPLADICCLTSSSGGLVCRAGILQIHTAGCWWGIFGGVQEVCGDDECLRGRRTFPAV